MSERLDIALGTPRVRLFYCITCELSAVQAERAEDAAKRGLTTEEALEANMEAEFAIDDIYGNMWCALLIQALARAALHTCKRLHRAPACQ